MSINEKTRFKKSKFTRFLQFLVQLIVAALVTFFVASTLHTQSVLSNLIAIGAEIPFAIRIETVFKDYLGLLPSYGVIIFIGMLIAMPIAGLISKTLSSKSQKEESVEQSPNNETQLWLFALAGAVAIFTILAAMQPIMNITIIAGARGFSGMFTQSIAGAIGGGAFALVRSRFA
ncbi:hypothetical protein [Glaciecola sp.]|uniref:hypothetical protein n=1 Tax=Glaciecola sp. MF2-115 TaxID=3384827 RepID=UPI003988C2D4